MLYSDGANKQLCIRSRGTKPEFDVPDKEHGVIPI